MAELTEIERQRAYYRETAGRYDEMHVTTTDEHSFALAWLAALIRFYGFRRVLDVGCGTGRAVLWLSQQLPGVEVYGLEPVPELAAEAVRKGCQRDRIIEGDALKLPFKDGSFDLVCEFAVLHHIRDNRRAVQEMMRVADKGIFISDCNNFGQGRPLIRLIKQALHKAGMWPAADFIKTRGRGYTESEGDGIAYSYSVFDSVDLVTRKFSLTHFMNTTPSPPDLYRCAPQVAAFFTRR